MDQRPKLQVEQGVILAELSTTAREIRSSLAGRWWVSPRAVAGQDGATARWNGGRRCVGQTRTGREMRGNDGHGEVGDVHDGKERWGELIQEEIMGGVGQKIRWLIAGLI